MRQALFSILLGVAGLSFPFVAFAHQPRIVDNGALVLIEQPEVSKVFYGQLNGKPQLFQITSAEPFTFYMNILVPDVAGAKKDVSVVFIDVAHPETPFAILNGLEGPWTPFFEPFSGDNYFKGPEFRSVIPAGTYQIGVGSTKNDSAYSLAVGESESFGLSDIFDAYRTIPEIKVTFFHKPAYTAFLTPFLAGPVILLIIAFGAVLFYVRKRSLRSA